MDNKLTLNKNIISIDIMKALCLIGVILTHSGLTMPQRTELFFPFYATQAVPVFLIISGFTFSMASEGKMLTIWDWYKSGNMQRRIMRILPAFLVAYLIEMIYFICFKHVNYSLTDIIKIFVTGGLGQGGYYTIIILQIIVVFPIIYFSFKANPVKTAIIVVLINLFFEIIKIMIDIPFEFYRLSILHYIVHILLGVFLYFYRDKIIGTYIPLILFSVGFIYLLHVGYLGYGPVIFTTWPSTTMLSAPYAFSLLYIIMNFENQFKKHGKLFIVLSEIGKASYHIFLTQMVYDAALNIIIQEKYSVGIAIIFHIVISLIVGYIFYRLEKVIKGLLTKKTKVAAN